MTSKLTRWEMAKAIAGDQSSTLELRWLKKDEHGKLFGEGTVYSSYKKIREAGDGCFRTELTRPTDPLLPEFKIKPRIIRFLETFNDLDLANALMNGGRLEVRSEDGKKHSINISLMIVNQDETRVLFGEDEGNHPIKISEQSP